MKRLSKIMILFLSLVLICPAFTNAEGSKQSERQTQELSPKAAQLMADMRVLWTEHAFWTERYVVSAIAGHEDQEVVLARLLKNQDDIGNAIKPFYGEEVGNKLALLLREHIQIAGKVLAAAKSGNQPDFKKYNDQWFKNADEITDFLISANPHFNKNEIKEMFYMHLKLVTQSVAARINKDYNADIAAFDKNLAHLLHMSDAITDGIIKQFPDKF
ncbi:glycosyltransferase [Neobacillus sp. NPDC093182]|uniref:glycosyltransferase n=1 Tax=Neobacillus sp. NPDC093182 TaxID=3364297 RepID=UPI0037F52A98